MWNDRYFEWANDYFKFLSRVTTAGAFRRAMITGAIGLALAASLLVLPSLNAGSATTTAPSRRADPSDGGLRGSIEIADDIIERGTGITSAFYRESGFDGLTFGMSKADIERVLRDKLVSPRVIETEDGQFPVGLGETFYFPREIGWSHRLFLVKDTLVTIERQYDDRQGGMATEIVKEFGDCRPEDTITTRSEQGVATIWRYNFPQVIVRATVDRTRVGFADYAIAKLSFSDRKWVNSVLKRELSGRAEALNWLKHVMDWAKTDRADGNRQGLLDLKNTAPNGRDPTEQRWQPRID